MKNQALKMLLTEASNKPKRLLFTTVIQRITLKVLMMSTSLVPIMKPRLRIKLNLRFSLSHSALILMKMLSTKSLVNTVK
jgi:hypothetical protein